jgi:competence protein ComEC
MPLIANAYVVFAAGLTLGYAHFGVRLTGLLALAGVLALLFLRRSRPRIALTFLFLGAVALAAGESGRTLELQAIPPNPVLQAARDRASRSIDAIFRDDAPLAKALLVADRQQIPQEMNDAFVAAGLVHILSISGLHVGIIAASVTLLLESARISRRASAIVTLVVIGLYVALLGAQPPALRAAVMVSAVTLGKISQRPTSPWALLAIGAFIPLVQPGVVLNLGYQLSVAGMAALIAGGAFAKRALSPRLKGVRLKLCSELATSVIATLVSAPLIAWTFGRLSLIGPVSNIAATPIVAVLQPLLFLAMLLAPAPDVARFAADAAHPLLIALNYCAHFFGSVPGAVVGVSPSWPSTICAMVAVCALVIAIISRFPARPLIVGAFFCAVGVAAPFPVFSSGKLEMHMLDVGQGDAILLRTPRGRWILVDAGRAWAGGDAGRSVVIPYIQKRGGELTTFILSHPHMDHVGGAATVLRALHPHFYWDAAFAGGNAGYRSSLEVASSEGTAWRRVHPGESVNMDGVSLSFLAPDSAWTASLADANEASTVVLVQYGMVRFLLTGDAEQDEERWLIEHAPTLRADVLKVGHHGSSTSSGDGFIRKVCPQVALISVGAINSYGHPSADVIAAFRRLGALVLRTDHEGTIVVRSDGSSVEVQTAEKHWDFSRQLSGSSSEVPSNCQAR